MNQREQETPDHVLVSFGVHSDHAEQIAVYLATNELIQAAAVPSIEEWRRGGYMNIFMNEPLPDPERSARLAVLYAKNLFGGTELDLILRKIRMPGGVPSYPGLDTLQTLVILKHGEASIEELTGKASSDA